MSQKSQYSENGVFDLFGFFYKKLTFQFKIQIKYTDYFLNLK